MEIFLSFQNFNSRKKVTSGRVFFQWSRSILLSWCTNFLEQYFLWQFPLNFFDYNNILISVKNDAGHISVNTVRATVRATVRVTVRVLNLVIAARGNFTFNLILTVKTSLLGFSIPLTN